MPKTPLKETPGSAEERRKQPLESGYGSGYQGSYTGGYNPEGNEDEDDLPADPFEGAEKLPKQ